MFLCGNKAKPPTPWSPSCELLRVPANGELGSLARVDSSRPWQKSSAPFPSRKGRKALNQNSQRSPRGAWPGPSGRPTRPPGLRYAASSGFLLLAALSSLGNVRYKFRCGPGLFKNFLLGSATFLGQALGRGIARIGLRDVAFSPRTVQCSLFKSKLRK